MEIKILWADGSDAVDVISAVRTILETPAGTVPFDRDFGIDSSIIDLPYNRAAALLQSEYINKIMKYEPRADVQRVTVSLDASGTLSAEVVIGSA